MEIKNIIKEHITWRHQIFNLAKSDLKKTYSGAALGWAWAFIKPIVTIFIYWFAFSFGLRKKAGIDGFPFILWLIAGMVCWFYISEMWNSGPTSMRRYTFLITKMKFPTSTIPTFFSLSHIVVQCVLVSLVMIVYILSGKGVSVYYIQLPFYMLLMFVMMTGWCLFSSVLGAMSKDFTNLVKAFSTALFWMSGMMFPISTIENVWARRILMANPVTFVVEGYRNCFVHHKWFYQSPAELGLFLAETLIMWCAAVRVFKKMKKEMPDVL